MKSKLFAFTVILVCLLPVSLVSAQGAGVPTLPVEVSDPQSSNKAFADALVKYRPLVGIPGISSENVTKMGFGDYINALYRLSISIAALLAVIKIIAAGVKYMFSDIVTQKSEAKKDIEGALLGLLIIVGAVIILNTVNTDITRNKILMEPTGADGTNAGVLDAINANRTGVGLFNSALEKCNAKYQTECVLDSSFTSKAECDGRSGFFIDGNSLKYTTGFGEGNLVNYCYYDPRIVPGTGVALQTNQDVFPCFGESNCANTAAACTKQQGTVIAQSAGNVICQGPTSCPAGQVLQGPRNTFLNRSQRNTCLTQEEVAENVLDDEADCTLNERIWNPTTNTCGAYIEREVVFNVNDTFVTGGRGIDISNRSDRAGYVVVQYKDTGETAYIACNLITPTITNCGGTQ